MTIQFDSIDNFVKIIKSKNFIYSDMEKINIDVNSKNVACLKKLKKLNIVTILPLLRNLEINYTGDNATFEQNFFNWVYSINTLQVF